MPSSRGKFGIGEWYDNELARRLCNMNTLLVCRAGSIRADKVKGKEEKRIEILDPMVQTVHDKFQKCDCNITLALNDHGALYNLISHHKVNGLVVVLDQSVSNGALASFSRQHHYCWEIAKYSNGADLHVWFQGQRVQSFGLKDGENSFGNFIESLRDVVAA